MKYTNTICIVTTAQGLRSLIGNPLFEAATEIKRASDTRELYKVTIVTDHGWFASDTTEDIINRITNDGAITTGVTADAQKLVSVVLAQSHGEFIRTGDNPKDIEKYVKLDKNNPNDSRLLYTKNEMKQMEKNAQDKLSKWWQEKEKEADKLTERLNNTISSFTQSQQPYQQPNQQPMFGQPTQQPNQPYMQQPLMRGPCIGPAPRDGHTWIPAYSCHLCAKSHLCPSSSCRNMQPQNNVNQGGFGGTFGSPFGNPFGSK